MILKVVSVWEGVYRRYGGCIREGILKKYVWPLTIHNIDDFIWKQLKFITKSSVSLLDGHQDFCWLFITIKRWDFVEGKFGYVCGVSNTISHCLMKKQKTQKHTSDNVRFNVYTYDIIFETYFLPLPVTSIIRSFLI